MSDDTLGVALTKCFYCQEDNEIVLNTRLTTSMASKVKELHGKVIDMRPCPSCEEHMRQGVIIITIDPHNSPANWHMPPPDLEEGNTWMPNPYRSGGWFVIHDEAIRNMLTGDEESKELANWAIEHRWMFMEHEAAVQIGLFDLAEEEGGEDAPKTEV